MYAEFEFSLLLLLLLLLLFGFYYEAPQTARAWLVFLTCDLAAVTHCRLSGLR
jgi:hypothetical protein